MGYVKQPINLTIKDVKMEMSNIIALALGGIGFLISIVGLTIRPHLDLKSKVLEKKFEYRSKLFHKILDMRLVNEKLGSDEFRSLMLEVGILIQLYGYDEEIKSFNESFDCYNCYAKEKNEDNIQKLNRKFTDFYTLSFNTYRKELLLEDKWTD